MLRLSCVTAQRNKKTSFLNIANMLWTFTLMRIFQNQNAPKALVSEHKLVQQYPAIILEWWNPFVSDDIFILSMTILA